MLTSDDDDDNDDYCFTERSLVFDSGFGMRPVLCYPVHHTFDCDGFVGVH